MKNYKQLMSKIEETIASRDKKAPVSVSGLLSPTKTHTMPKSSKDDDITIKLADYVSFIRKQSKGLSK